MVGYNCFDWGVKQFMRLFYKLSVLGIINIIYFQIPVAWIVEILCKIIFVYYRLKSVLILYERMQFSHTINCKLNFGLDHLTVQLLNWLLIIIKHQFITVFILFYTPILSGISFSVLNYIDRGQLLKIGNNMHREWRRIINWYMNSFLYVVSSGNVLNWKICTGQCDHDSTNRLWYLPLTYNKLLFLLNTHYFVFNYNTICD